MNIEILPQPKHVSLESFKQEVDRPFLKRKISGGISREGYEIDFEPDRIVVSASDEKGFFYAGKTLDELKRMYGFSFLGKICDFPDIKQRIAMLDFKRIDWKIDMVLELLRDFSRLKINTCLVEYEDKFPFETVDHISCNSAFTRDEIRQICMTAEENHIELIPLIQCFSHWEYILKHKEWSGIREVSDAFSQACPLDENTFALFRMMTDEIISAHPNIKSVHIGADEARYLGKCRLCAEKVRQSGIESLYGDYLRKVIGYVNSKGLHAFFWGDFYRRHDHISQIAGLDCTAVDWSYAEQAVYLPSVYFPRKSTGIISYGDAEVAEFQDALMPDHEKRMLFAFPHRIIMEADAQKTIGAGIINSPWNILAHAQSALKLGSEGIIGTYWASSQSLSTPYSILPLRKAGIAMLGTASWNCSHETENTGTFYSRITKMFADDSLSAEEFIFLDSMEHHFLKPTSPEELDIPSGDNPVVRKFQIEKKLCEIIPEKQMFSDKSYFLCDLSKAENSTVDFCIAGKKHHFTDEILDFLPETDWVSNGIRIAGRKAVAIYGNIDSDIPSKLSIPCGRRTAHAISILQSAVGGVPDTEGKWGELRLFYSDGSEHMLELVQYENLGGWYQIKCAANAPIGVKATKGKPPYEILLGLHLYTFFNPYPEKKIESLELKCTSGGVIALAGITLTEPDTISHEYALIRPELHILKNGLAVCKTDMESMLCQRLRKDSIDEILKISFAGLESRIQMLETFYKICPPKE